VSDELNQYAGIALGDLDRSSVEERWHEATGDDHRRVFWLPGAPIQRVLRVLVDGGDPGPLTVNVKSGYVALARPPSADATVEIHYEVGSEGDLLVATRPASGQPGGIFVYSNSGGELPAKRTRTIGDATNRYKSLALVDMDLDGDLDLVAAGAGPAPVALYTNDEGALRTSPGWIPADTDQKAEDLAVGDFNADGYPDVCVVQFAGGPAVRIYRNDRGVLEPTPSVAIPYIGAAIGSVGSGDVNGDGVTDLFLGLAGAPARAYVSQSPPADPPVVNRVSAAGFEPGRGGSITIEGAGFVLPVRVYLGERMLDNVTLASSTSIAADLPADLAEDRYDVVVVNPDLRSGIAAGAVTIGAHPKSDNQEDGGSSDASGCRSAGGDGASSFAPFPALALALWLARRRSCKRSG
jgi:MYXO-CTERM domain-containing protein